MNLQDTPTLSQKPICAACDLLVEDHFGPIDLESTYLCARPACKQARAELSRNIESVFNEYETDFADDERRTEAAEAEVNLIAAKKAARAQRGLTVQMGSTLYRKLRREWPEATDEAILSVTIERARKAKPPQWAELIRDNKNPALKDTVPDSDRRFQTYANDPALGGGSAPEGTDHIPGAAGNASRVTQDMGGSEENIGWSTFDTGSVSRRDTPEWIKDEKSFDEFFEARDRKTVQISNEDIIYSWEVGRELDRLILKDYYFGRRSDKQIFEDYKNLFELERHRKIERADFKELFKGKTLFDLVFDLDSKGIPKRGRWTVSADAVKHRRMRLLREWDALLGTRKVWVAEKSWRGIIVKHMTYNADGQWYESLGGIATKKQKAKALIVAEDSGYTGRWEGDLADLVAEETFDSWEALVAWMAKFDLILRESNSKESAHGIHPV